MFPGFHGSVCLVLVIIFSSPAIAAAQLHNKLSNAPTAQEESLSPSPSPPPDARLSPSPTPLPQASPLPSPTPKKKSLEREFFKNIARDQAAIWTAPFRIGKDDAKSVVPFGAAAATLIAIDRHTSAWVSQGGSLPDFSEKVSFIGSNQMQAAIVGSIYIVGRATKNARARETGVLAGQAMINSTIVAFALKTVTRRPRPSSDNGRGRFFKGGRSFPSAHSSNSWAVATVISYEYQHRPLIRYGSFAAAAVVTLSRYSGRNHFLSDLLVGSTIGFLTGRYVYKKHHVQPAEATSKDGVLPKTSKRYVPELIPVFDARSATYGAKLVWSL